MALLSQFWSGRDGWLFVITLIAALVAIYRPFGDYLYRVVSGTRHNVVERTVYRLVGVNANAEQTWGVYARSVLAFSAVSILFLYLFLRVQNHLWLSLGFGAVPTHIAWNTAVSFTTNTNWQAYSGESTMGHLVQMAGLAVQNFVSASVGIAVAIALVRGFAARRSATLGNFWVDLTRITLRVLLPACVVITLVFMVAGMVQNLSAGTDVTTLTGATQHITGGPVASQEAIKEFGTNGGGFSTPTRPTPSRTRRAGPTGWRSSCCWRSRSACPGCSAGWPARTGRATPSSPSWPSSR